MLLDSLTLKDFGLHAETRIDFGGVPVAVVMGPNRAGKSTIADAVRFLLRNAARGVGGASNRALVRRGATTCKVAATLRARRDGEAFAASRTPSGSDTTTATLLRNLGVRDEAAIDAALDAGRFLALTPKERKALAFRASGCVLDEPTLHGAGIDDAEVLAAALAKGPEAAERLATERKRAANRAADEVRRPEPTDVAVPTAAGPKAVSSIDPVVIADVVAGLRKERDAATRALEAAERGVSAAARAAQQRAAADAALAKARRDLAAAQERAAAAARGRKASAALLAEAEGCLPASQEPAPERPAPPDPVEQPSTADGEAARAAVGAAESVALLAVERSTAAAAALNRAQDALAAARRGAWAAVVAVADELDAGKVAPDAAARLRALAREHGPDLAALSDAADRAAATVKDAGAAVETTRKAWEAAKARLADVAVAWRSAKANADARAARLADEHKVAMEVWQKRTDERNARVRAATDRRRALLADADAVVALERADARAVADAAAAVAEAEGRLAGVEQGAEAAPVADPAALRDQIERLERDVEVAERAGREARSYREARAAWKATRARVEALAAEAARFERMERALRPDGVVGRIVAGPLGTLREVLARLAPDVRVSDDWEVLIRDAASTLASRSEQWRAGTALAVALAAVSGVRFAILDDADVLVDDRERRALIGSLVQLREHFDQVVVITAASPDATAAAKAPRGDVASLVGLWRVLDGRVERVVETPAAAPAAA